MVTHISCTGFKETCTWQMVHEQYTMHNQRWKTSVTHSTTACVNSWVGQCSQEAAVANCLKWDSSIGKWDVL